MKKRTTRYTELRDDKSNSVRDPKNNVTKM